MAKKRSDYSGIINDIDIEPKIHVCKNRFTLENIHKNIHPKDVYVWYVTEHLFGKGQGGININFLTSAKTEVEVTLYLSDLEKIVAGIKFRSGYKDKDTKPNNSK